MSVTLDDIRAARERISGIANRTPVISDKRLSNLLGADAWLKAECLQRAGSFKIRGALNKISQLTDDERSRGVIAASAGNHAQGVALAAKLAGIRSTIVVPEFAPLTKVIATRSYGAEVILHGASFDEAVAYSKELQRERELAYVHAFDDELIIAGQGTIGLELLEELEGVDTVVVPVGGGGIISGIATAIKALRPEVRIFGVQSEHVPSIRESLDAGHPVEVSGMMPTIADGIAVKRPGQLTLPIIEDLVEAVVEVSEDEIARGIFHCSQSMHIVAEGAGAAGVAALISGKIPLKPHSKVATVICGGNIDANVLARILEQIMVRDGRYVIVKVLVMDRPGMLAGVLNQVAETGANVVEVYHQRAIWLAPLGRVGIEMILEVRDPAHAEEVVTHLQNVGYQVEREGQADWSI